MTPVATRSDEAPLRVGWRVALAVFALAGLTGAVFRGIVASGTTLRLDLTNVRHAHSHLMYFGWATPALFALVAHRLPGLGGAPIARPGRLLVATFALALAAFPPFLLVGYGVVAVGPARLPLPMMLAGANVLAWYAFVALYVRARRDAPPPGARALLDAAVALLVLATLGAWGLPVLQIAGDGTHVALQSALTHLFLDAFSEGWFVLGVLALAAAEARADGRAVSDRVLRASAVAVALGVPFTFALAMPPALVPPTFAALARVGSGLVGAGLLTSVAALWRGAAPGWRVALALLALKAAAQVAVGTWPALAGVAGVRVLYLHAMLLGFVTLGLAAAARGAFGRAAVPGHAALVGTVGVLLASLVLLTPAGAALAPGGRATAVALAVGALGPPLVAAWMAARAR